MVDRGDSGEGSYPGPSGGAESPGGAGPDAGAGRYTGVIARPIGVTAAAVSGRSSPGLLAVSVAALISVAAWVGRALFADMSTGLFLAGIVVPVVLVVGVAVAQRLRPAAGDDAVWELTVRTDDGRRLHASMRTDADREFLFPGDLIRMTPARHANLLRKTPDRLIPLRSVELLTGSGGQVSQRIKATSALPPVQLAGLVLAVALLVATVITFLTA
ncbi:hypothetical protein [Actinoplanes couchii]|uniref:Uncharacterized protein n=1 Tax=Actinoplanes couchii TaxID=403638 RepID=A0ABQ3XMP1_9ACTN|nr:hypothetical protein [Actinoplanes couchii]GID59735.1 hypothetical protein Aco03nite_081390 [Actinoplanes couchii]